MVKACTKCGIEKQEEMFSFRTKGKRKTACKDCTNSGNLAHKKDNNLRSWWHYHHKTDKRKLSLKWIKQWADKKASPEYQEKRKKIEAERERLKPIRRQRKRELRKLNQVARMSKDGIFALRVRIAKRINAAIKHYGCIKSGRTVELLGCSISDARSHIESMFRDGMTWGNYGSLWQIDHITPIASFDIREPSQQLAAFNYKNIQPLLKFENMRKSDFLPNGKRGRHLRGSALGAGVVMEK